MARLIRCKGAPKTSDSSSMELREMTCFRTNQKDLRTIHPKGSDQTHRSVKKSVTASYASRRGETGHCPAVDLMMWPSPKRDTCQFTPWRASLVFPGLRVGPQGRACGERMRNAWGMVRPSSVLTKLEREAGLA